MTFKACESIEVTVILSRTKTSTIWWGNGWTHVVPGIKIRVGKLPELGSWIMKARRGQRERRALPWARPSHMITGNEAREHGSTARVNWGGRGFGENVQTNFIVKPILEAGLDEKGKKD